MNKFVAVAGLAVVAVVLAGCSTPAETTPVKADRSPTGSPTPSPSTSAPTIATIELGPEFTRAVRSDGSEAWRVDYDSDPASVVARLTSALGPASPSEHAGTPNGDADLPRTDYSWGGLTLESPHYSGAQPSGDGFSDYSVVATSRSAHGVALVSSSGVAVGMSDSALAPIAARYSADPVSADGWTQLEPWKRDHDGTEVTDWIAVHSDGGAVDRIFATSHSYGA